jgi:hypothetical protein
VGSGMGGMSSGIGGMGGIGSQIMGRVGSGTGNNPNPYTMNY